MEGYVEGFRITRSNDRSRRVLSVEALDEDGNPIAKLPVTSIGSHQEVYGPQKITLEVYGFRVEEVLGDA